MSGRAKELRSGKQETIQIGLKRFVARRRYSEEPNRKKKQVFQPQKGQERNWTSVITGNTNRIDLIKVTDGQNRSGISITDETCDGYFGQYPKVFGAYFLLTE